MAAFSDACEIPILGIKSALIMTKNAKFLLFLSIAGLAFAPFLSHPVWASAAAPQKWGIGCYDNNCVWITDPSLISQESFTVSTLAADGAVLGSYAATSAGNTITFRPSSVAELKLLSSNTGLLTSVSSRGNSTPILEFAAIKAVTGTSNAIQSGHLELSIHLNGNPSFQSSSYTVNFLDAPSQKNIGVAANVSANNPSLLSVDLSGLPAVANAYNSEGVFLQIANSEGLQLNGEYYAQASDFGMLDNFYRATQLQDTWTLLGQNLLNVQSGLWYLFAPAVDVPYLPKFGANSTEIPFADSFVITHFLGGNTVGGVSKICTSSSAYQSYCDPVEPWSLDYLVSKNKKLTYQSALVYDRLNPYLNAGYQPRDITIGLDNVPWAIASKVPPQNRSTCVQEPNLLGTLGVWGQCNPPAEFPTWRDLITHLTGDLTAEYGATASQFNYAVGDEFDVTSTYNGRPDDFYNLYQFAFQAVRAAFPIASVVPGDFSGEGSCRFPYFTGPIIPGCTYDTQAFLHHEIALGMVPTYIPRSANNFWDINQGPTPSATATDVINSYAYVETANATVLPEIHQFGFLDMPFGPVGDDTSSLSANWDFQALLALKQGLPNIGRVFNWGGVESAAGLNFLNGNGWIRMLFDNLQGSELYMLPVTPKGALPANNEVMAVGIVDGDNFWVFVSNFDLPVRNKDLTQMQFDPPIQLQITLPAAWVTGHPSWNYLRYSESPVDNVFAQIKTDFGANVLTSQFAQCSVCFASPMTMATIAEAATAREILAANFTNGRNYVGIMQNGLKWRGVHSAGNSGQLNIDSNGLTHNFSQSGNVITVTVGANEMLVLRPQ
jgi:hypothetical protein